MERKEKPAATSMIEIIAELGVNWNGDSQLLEDMVLAAKVAGASAVKFQAFLPEHVKGHPKAEELVKSALNEDNVDYIADLAKTDEIEWFATPFYPEAVDFLEEAGVKRYKIREKDGRALVSQDGSSSPIEPTPLIKKVMDTHKPVCISVQRKPLDLHWLYHPEITWLYCVPKYPAPLEDLELWKCGQGYGFSCHTPDLAVPLAAASAMLSYPDMGTRVIEVHVSNEPKADYPDGNVSFNFDELKQIINTIRAMEKMKLERPF